MQNKQAQLDKIQTEHNYMRVGDPVPVNHTDDHAFEITEHKKQLAEIKDDDTQFTAIYKKLLQAHIDLHDEYAHSQIK
jgi:hypothetical protein